MSTVAWLTRKMAVLGSIRSFKSVSSTTSTYANGLSKKPINRSQLSIYDKISRNLSIFDSHKGEARSRKSSRQRSVSDVTPPKLEELNGAINKSYEKEDTEKTDELEYPRENNNLLLERKFLEPITENQNSPYSTQASQCTTRRMSAQSIFPETSRRGSTPLVAPITEIFNENELEEKFLCDEKPESANSAVSELYSHVEKTAKSNESDQDDTYNSNLLSTPFSPDENDRERSPTLTIPKR